MCYEARFQGKDTKLHALVSDVNVPKRSTGVSRFLVKKVDAGEMNFLAWLRGQKILDPSLSS